MDYLTPLLIIALSAVFLTSAIAKLLDFEASKKSAAEFGVPVFVAGAAMSILIVLEFSIALLLLFGSTNRAAALAATFLLFVFLIATARLVILGKSPDCRCFGQLSDEPVGKSSLVRNAVLLIMAGVLFVFYREFSFVEGTEDVKTMILTLSGFGLSALLITSMLIAFELRSKFGAVDERLQKIEKYSTLLQMHVEGADPGNSLPVGTLVPDLTITSLSGEAVGIRELTREGLPVLLIFVGPDCIPCEKLAVDFPAWAESLSGKVRLIVLSSGDAEVNIDKFGEQNRELLYLQNGESVSAALKTKWSPAAVVVGTNSRVASGPVAGDTAIARLVDEIEKMESLPDILFVGEELDTMSDRFGTEVPDFELPRLEGGVFAKSDLEGMTTMVVFWSLTCQLCTEMLDEMLSWHVHPENLNLVILADGDETKLRETGIGAYIVVDREYKVGGTMGMFGTPSAVIIDDSVTVVSETVQGGPQIGLLSGGAFEIGAGHEHR
ncbi:MAG: redoxin domain-containing protein [Acidobacteriota bacterium]|nr:redoxin domain-containing protein [Acidobacteriota bacterium]